MNLDLSSFKILSNTSPSLLHRVCRFIGIFCCYTHLPSTFLFSESIEWIKNLHVSSLGKFSLLNCLGQVVPCFRHIKKNKEETEDFCFPMTYIILQTTGSQERGSCRTLQISLYLKFKETLDNNKEEVSVALIEPLN